MTPIHTKISYDPRGFDALIHVLTDSLEDGPMAYSWMLREYTGQSIPELTRLAIENGVPMGRDDAQVVFGHRAKKIDGIRKTITPQNEQV